MNETLKLLNWMEGYKNYDDSMSSKRKEYIEPILISKYQIGAIVLTPRSSTCM